MIPRLRERWLRIAAGDRNRRVTLLVALGVLGIGLIALPELFGTKEEETTPAVVTVTAAQAETAMEERIASLLTQVAGVGECRVLVTLERDAQTVYAADMTTSGESVSEHVLTVETATGPVGLPLTTLLPAVKGVAVVCAGGEDPTVCDRVTQVVATAFHISERRVAVVSMK